MPLPRRLIEVDLPIKVISEHARREKSIRHGHISTLHIWWARRPLAACRAVLCAALWPDPADPACPPAFRQAALAHLHTFSERLVSLEKRDGSLVNTSPQLYSHAAQLAARGYDLSSIDELVMLRKALFAFIADFANWDNAANEDYLTTARALTQAAHEALGGAPGTRPLVVDPFAGGGAIPLEALRVGADAFASDLNPVAVLLNKVTLEYIPRYGQQLADAVREWGAWIKAEAEKELASFYPKDPDGATPIAYLWARTITCEGPGCGAEVPLMRSLWLSKKGKRGMAMRLKPVLNDGPRRVEIELVENPKDEEVRGGTVQRGNATCPCCGYVTPVARVREQLKARKGGAADARLLAVVTTRPGQQGRFYRLPAERDRAAARAAAAELERRKAAHSGPLTLVPDEEFSGLEPRRIPLPQYGMFTFGDLFTPRQLLALTTLASCTRQAGNQLRASTGDDLFVSAVQTCLALAVSRHSDINASLAMWHTTRELVTHVFGRQALPMVWDFAEAFSFGEAGGSYAGGVEWIVSVLENIVTGVAQVQQASAIDHPLPDDSVQALITDPPYYYSVPYSDLSDYFYVWLRRTLAGVHRELLSGGLSPREAEIVQNLPHSEVAHVQKDRAFYEHKMGEALADGRRILHPEGIGVVVFAHKDTDAWESLLSALVASGWCVTASWPIDTEMSTRLIAKRQTALASSIHLVCRPREGQYGDLTQEVGDWRAVLAELPRRIAEWLPRLEREGVVGADAIFACLGPAMEIFSRYARVEKASGEAVTLREYLEQVWAAVSRQALQLVFSDAETSGFEEDARLTAIWLWTLKAEAGVEPITPRPARLGEWMLGVDRLATAEEVAAEEADDEDEDEAGRGKTVSGYALDYDTARKIAQGLGAHLEKLSGIVAIRGNQARLLPVGERADALFGRGGVRAPVAATRRAEQMSMFDLMTPEVAESWRIEAREEAASAGKTTLDRLHQAMILHAAGQTDTLRRFLLEDGVGREARFWRLADALVRLYPRDSDERRWLEGLLARKKGLGL